MSGAGKTTVAVAAVVAIVACTAVGNHVSPATNLKRDSAFAERLRAAAQSHRDTMVAHWLLPSWLSEISGLTVRGNGLVLAHDDETARISLIDVKRGEVMKQFSLGSGAVGGDFEAITTVGDSIYLLSSKGVFFIFPEGADRSHVKYRTVDTKLGKECEFEGAVYDSLTTSFYLPCKRVLKKREKRKEAGVLVVYRLPMPLSSDDDATRFELALQPNDSSKAEPSFQASDITLDPTTGHLVALASRQRALLEFTSEGDVVREVSLPDAKKHQQPEGIAITRDGLLVVSDESVRNPAAITVYRWPLASMEVVP